MWAVHEPPSGPTWQHHPDRQLFARFVLVFGLLMVLGCAFVATLAAVALLFFEPRAVTLPNLPFRAHPRGYVVFLVVAALVLALAFRLVGKLAARRITSPLSATMQAAETLAAGDLSARVPEQGSAEFRRLARSFNHMAQALQTADRQRRELLADVAHELRTPLSVIQGNLEGLRDGVYEPTAEHLDLVLDETHKLGRLVDDLRLLTLAEAGQLPLDMQEMDVAQLLADVREAFAHQADEQGIELALDVAAGPEVVPSLRADPRRLGQVLNNLVTNALRHTPPGGTVTLGAATLPGGVRLWVADTGEGIPAADLPHIFDRFWRGDPARSHTAGAGTGLGLAIARSLVEAHGGRIWATSDGVPGRGTVISVALPSSH